MDFVLRWKGGRCLTTRALGAVSAVAVLGLALLGPVIGHGWIGHGLYKVALFGLPLLAGLRISRPARCAVRDHLLGAVTGIVLGLVAAAALCWILPSVTDPRAIRAGLDLRYGFTPTTAVLAAGLLLSANALLEEWFYRAYLDRLLPVLLSSLVFGIQHTIVLWEVAGALPAVIGGLAVVPAGLVWSHLARKTESIAIPFCSHAWADLILFSAGLDLLGYR